MEIKFKKEFEVKITRKISVGMTCRINNNDGCIGIPIGLITVIDIWEEKDMNDSLYDSYDFSSWEVDGVIPEHWVKFQWEDGNITILPLEKFINQTSIT